MLNFITILGGIIVGGAFGLLGRHYDNKASKEYKRGYKDGYKTAKGLFTSSKDHLSKVFYTEHPLGHYLYEAHRMQRDAKNCCIDIYFKENDFLKLIIISGQYEEKREYYNLAVNSPEGLNDDIFHEFQQKYKYLENKHHD